MKEELFSFDARVVSVHCFIFPVKKFCTLTEARDWEVSKSSQNPGFYSCQINASEACWWRKVGLHNWTFALGGDLHFLQFSGRKGIRTGLTFLETFPSGLESWEFIQPLCRGWVILMSIAFNARALFSAVSSELLFTLLCPFEKTLPFSRAGFRVILAVSSS